MGKCFECEIERGKELTGKVLVASGIAFQFATSQVTSDVFARSPPTARAWHCNSSRSGQINVAI